jgi:hypothetical protein
VIGRRRRSAVAAALELELRVPDEPQALLDHFCAGSGEHRLLGVAFTEEERALLRAGEVVALVLRCDRCIWERRVLFRLER